MPDAADPGLLSLVIPVFNEHDSLAPLLAEITGVVAGIDLRVEVVFVDDGSTDGSWQLVRELAAKDERVRGIRFRRNFGKAAALEAGFKAARGGIVMTLDADLQDDPHEIPNFLKAVRGGLDVVSGWKKVRLDPIHKTFPSRVFNRMVGVVTKVHLHDHNCGFKAYRADVLRELHLYGEMHRFVPVLAAGRGFRVGELAIHHRPRKFGRSKYGWQRFVKGFLDLVTVHFLTKFGRRPQHLLGSYGLLVTGLGFLGFFALLVNLIVHQIDPAMSFGALTQLYVLLLSGGLVLGGAQFLFTGLLAELVVARKMMEQEPFSVVERTQQKE
ncbi:glycosyl transferase family 2 : Dolichol-phosphate mannosyltransferase OS=Blastopirellula marina DSM 3645 GN=DSM3645_04225 PE=4 SV=1: Glycos_transf_2 [Gemmataceae bacterium]|nr:glycosyl transferase family 2 : Dolichol-phosphate mannosyltransferase OS=Blastopirellula marina DSM 3645 GN=DSM3645_04225 PE=4 SV=1: Glycos_transf_2 [Gemmataceae bacterium]VTT96374.1 glycosyl transferase family 2 : Dolichol-phosphate mannosyltransferase OS=Blastopirellula marina DSM 3645 GN=DSM3645_04225 PE=4 SV=1: Glycos_transf_2 [Gemmataceae bacterium]